MQPSANQNARLVKKAGKIFFPFVISCSTCHAVYYSLLNVVHPWAWRYSQGHETLMAWHAFPTWPSLCLHQGPCLKQRKNRGMGSWEPILRREWWEGDERGLHVSWSSRSLCVFYCSIGFHLQNTISKIRLLRIQDGITEYRTPIVGYSFEWWALYTCTSHTPGKLALIIPSS